MLLPAMLSVARALVAMSAGDADLEAFDINVLVREMAGGSGAAVTAMGLICWCVITVWLVSANGQSIGKRMTRIKVVRTDGSPATFARIFLLRNLVNSLPLVIPTLGFVYQLIDPLLIFQDSRRCIHDMIADTVVVRCGPETPAGVS